MSDLAAAVLAAIAERRKVAEEGARDPYADELGEAWYELADHLDAWEVVVRECGHTLDWWAWGCRHCLVALETAARLFLTAEQQVEYGIEPVPA